MSSALDICHAARRAWERSQPQLFLELDEEVDESLNTTDPGRTSLDGSARPGSGGTNDA